MLTGRQKEVKILNEALEYNESQFIAIYGRRRVGKTFLVKETYGQSITFQCTGIYNEGKKEQLKNFANSLKLQGYKSFSEFNDWIDAFQALKEYLNTKDDNKKIIFLDELSWMDTKKSGFLAALENFWNGWATYRNDIVLVICASSASWIIKKVVHNKGGLHNRLNHQIKIEPFDLRECRTYLESRGIHMDHYSIVLLYMALGGVPYYWSLIEKGYSAHQMINRLFFEGNAVLENEFEHLYRSIFCDYESYIKIIKALSTKKIGLKREEIIVDAKMADNGMLTDKLKDLEVCGFIRKYYKYGSKNKDSVYQLVDNFTLFYYRFLEKKSNDEKFWINNLDSQAVKVWEGLAYEIVAFQHIAKIKEKLGISGIYTNALSYRAAANLDDGIYGSQIDLLLERKDGIVNVCEVKFSNTEYVVTKDTAMSIRHKVSDFLKLSRTKATVNVVLITTYGLMENGNSADIVSVITMDDLFR